MRKTISRALNYCVVGIVSSAIVAYGVAQAQPTPAPAPSPSTAPNVNQSMYDLQVQMAESTHKMIPSTRSLSDLMTALENYLTSGCFGPIFKTLSYEGPPADPSCKQRMEQLLDLHPSNPVGVCARDGLAAQSCIQAYKQQSVRRFNSGDRYGDIADASLRVGLTLDESSKVATLSANLQSINSRYQEAKSKGDKSKLFALIDEATQLYEQILSITCKSSVTALEELAKSTRSREEQEIQALREKLRKVPRHLRGDYQEQALQDAERELAQAASNPTKQEAIKRKIHVIQNPEENAGQSTMGSLRVRLLLPQCYDYVEQASAFLPNFAAPICHKNGWYSPQCVGALKGWYAYRQRLEAEVRASDPNRPTPRSVISSF